MHINLKTNLTTTLAAATLLLALGSCGKEDAKVPEQPKTGEAFILQVTPSANDGVSAMHYLTRLDSGTASIVNSQETPQAYRWERSTSHNGKYYIYTDEQRKFTKFGVNAAGQVVEEQSIRFANVGSMEWANYFHWVDDNRLLVLIGNDGAPTTPYSYALVNVTGSMSVERQGIINLSPDTASQLRANFAIKRGDKMYIGVSPADKNTGVARDSVRVAVFDFATMNLLSITKDARSAEAGGYNQSVGVAENGDIYFTSQPSVEVGQRADKPSGIFRIKAGADVIDPTYFFDLSAKVNGWDNTGFHYLGNGKAVTKMMDGSIIQSGDDYYTKYGFEHYVLDLNAQTATKLAMPITKGYLNFVPLNSGKWAFLGNSATENAIYILDPANSTVKKGLIYQGASDLEVIDRL